MGVSGSGKTTIGKALAADLGWKFLEGDEFHPAENVEKMRSGVPLDDQDRRPWLQAMRNRVDEACERNENVILACSALKDEYRDFLELNDPECVDFVYLQGSIELIQQRLHERRGHFMDPALLQSQFAALEPPDGAIEVNVSPPPDVIAAEIRRKLSL